MTQKEEFVPDKEVKKHCDENKGITPKPEQDKERQRLLEENKAVPNPIFPHSVDEEEDGPKPLKLKPDEDSHS